jgi:uncharacterized protein (TIGR02300 family)
MPKDEWGVKRLCPHCASRFYDLRRDPMTCPECGHSFTVDSLTATRGRVLIADKVAPRARAAEVDVEELDTETELDDSSDVDLDDDLLEDDEDDNVSLDEIADVSGPDEET